MGDDLLNAIGLLLTQLRVSRRALEDIERSTARYNSFAFAAALSAGAKFGEPPMFGGALKVWVVNINDLAPGAGGGFLEQVLGGIGRFLGGFGGGVVGGVLGGLALPDMIADVQKIADSVENILTRLGIDLSAADKKKEDKGAKGPSLIDTLTGLSKIFKDFTAFFLAGSGKPEEAEKTSSSLTPGAKQWLAIIDTASGLMKGIDLVVQGLTFLIPIIVGALAEFIVQLDQIKLAIVRLLEFLLREIFLLRGVILATIYDTLSAVAKLASSVLGILSVAVNSIVGSIFNIFGEVFKAAIATIKFLSDGLETTITSLVQWLVKVIGDVLFTIGDSLVFREIVHVVQMLPGILPPLVLAIRGEEAFGKIDKDALAAAAKIQTAAAAAPGTGLGAGVTPPPMISDTLLPKQKFDELSDTVGTAVGKVNAELNKTFGTATLGLKTVATQLEDAAKDKQFQDMLGPHIKEVQKNSQTLADAFKVSESEAAKAAAAGRPATGLEVIAAAYEKWLQGGGLKNLLDNLTKYFSEPRNFGPVKEQAVGPTTIDRPRATVDIQDMIIQVEPPPEEPTEDKTPGKQLQTPGETLSLLVELIHELSERGFQFDPGSMLLQV